MIRVKREYHNGINDGQDLYSDIGMKILDKRDGHPYDNNFENPIAITKVRRDDYVETDEPVDMSVFEALEKIIKEDEKINNE